MITIVGLAPSSQDPDRLPLDERSFSGRRLASLAGVPGRLHEVFRCVNLLPSMIGRPRGSERATMRANALRLLANAEQDDVFVLLGVEVSNAFRHRGDLFDEYELDVDDDKSVWVVTAPHPSGLSHWWNDRANYSDAQLFWEELASR